MKPRTLAEARAELVALSLERAHFYWSRPRAEEDALQAREDALRAEVRALLDAEPAPEPG